MLIPITDELIARVTRDYKGICKEEVKVEFIAGAMYVFGSELACLRLHYKMQNGRVGWSANLNTWYYSREMQF